MGRMKTADKKNQFTRKVVCRPCTPLKEHVTDESYEENGKPSAGRFINRSLFLRFSASWIKFVHSFPR